MRETGIISKHQRHWMAQKPPCLSNALFTSIDFASTIASIEMLIIGYLLSIMILLLEILLHRKIMHGQILDFLLKQKKIRTDLVVDPLKE